jgi:hypothetical protein
MARPREVDVAQTIAPPSRRLISMLSPDEQTTVADALSRMMLGQP